MDLELRVTSGCMRFADMGYDIGRRNVPEVILVYGLLWYTLFVDFCNFHKIVKSSGDINYPLTF